MRLQRGCVSQVGSKPWTLRRADAHVQCPDKEMTMRVLGGWVGGAALTSADTKLKIFRRFALAYATHGAPLRYFYLNRTSIGLTLRTRRCISAPSIRPR